MGQSQSSILDTIEAIRTGLEKGSKLDLASLLLDFKVKEPDRWLSLLLLNNVLPEPGHPRFSQLVSTLSDCLRSSTQVSDARASPDQAALSGLLNIHASLSSIRSGLHEIGIWKKPGITPVLTTAAFIEDQWALCQKHLMSQAESSGFFDLGMVMADNFPTDIGNVHTNIQAAYENLCEDLQLILAHAIESFGPEFYGDVRSATQPYSDPNFKRLIYLATLWRVYKDLWGRVKYLDWRPEVSTEPNPGKLYVPRDREEYLRHPE